MAHAVIPHQPLHRPGQKTTVSAVETGAKTRVITHLAHGADLAAAVRVLGFKV